MATARAELLKDGLIKRELETTPWDALVELAQQKIIHELTNLSHDELGKRSLAIFGKREIDDRIVIKRMAEYLMVSSTTLEIVNHARSDLEAEYALIPEDDLETLYRLFIANDNSGATTLSSFSKDV